MNKRIRKNRILSILLSFLMALGLIAQGMPAFAQGSYPGAELIDDLSVSPQDITHTQDFTISLNFSGQSEDSNGSKYIYPGKEIYIPIVGDGVAYAQLNSTLPEIENAEVSADENGIKIRFLDGIENQYEISGHLRITMSGINTKEESTHTITVGREHKVNVANRVGGTTGVFAGKTGMMYGESNPGYVTWFLRGNINGDTSPGGPLKIHDKLGEGQALDNTGIKIGLHWGGQQHQTYSKTYSSIAEFLADPDYGSAAGSTVSYKTATGEIDIFIPESVLSEKEFSFTYNALITNPDLDEFTNVGEFDFHEKNKPGRIEENAVVTNIDVGGGIVGKMRASININKVVKGTEIPVPNVKFQVAREDGSPLFLGKDDLTVILTSNENGQIRANGFRPGKMILKEIDAPDWISYNPQKEISLDITPGNETQVETIENEIKKTEVTVTKSWKDSNNQDGKRTDSVTIKLHANGEVTDKELTLTQANNWTGTFAELDEYKNGKKIVYSIEEVEVDAYETLITGDAETGFMVTNTHEPQKITVQGSKTWNDNDNQDGKRPESITIKLLANGKEVARKAVTGEDWTWKFENLDKFENGEEIVYTITEDVVEGYSTEVKGHDVTNEYTPGKTSVQVTKAWKDSNNQDGKRADSVTIKLLANGEVTDKELTLTQANNWTGTFTELDEYKDGKKIVYSIEEMEVAAYETLITGDAETGFIVTNTLNQGVLSETKDSSSTNKPGDHTLVQTGMGYSLYEKTGLGLLIAGLLVTYNHHPRKKEKVNKNKNIE